MLSLSRRLPRRLTVFLKPYCAADTSANLSQLRDKSTTIDTSHTSVNDKIFRSRKFAFVETNSPVCAAQSERPLIVLLTWMWAKKKHMMKYADFYLERGADVLLAPGDPLVCLLPKRSAAAAADFRTVLSDLSLQHVQRPIVIHAFSIGCYLYTHFLKELCAAADQGEPECRALFSRIRGHIFDSATDYMNIANAVGKYSFPSNKVVQSVVRSTVATYNRLFTEKHYKSISEWIHQGIPTSVPPILMLFSNGDFVSPLSSSEGLMKAWSERGVRFANCRFEGSPHVLHMKHYPELYWSAVSSYVDSLALSGWRSDLQEAEQSRKVGNS